MGSKTSVFTATTDMSWVPPGPKEGVTFINMETWHFDAVPPMGIMAEETDKHHVLCETGKLCFVKMYT